MTIINLRHNKVTNLDGSVADISPPKFLQEVGPLIQVTLSSLDKNSNVAPVTDFALIDTGASTTCVDCDAATRAGLIVVGDGHITSATHESEPVPIFAGRLEFVGHSIGLNAPKALGANLAALGIIALIGRDAMQSCVLVYNGLDGSFSLSI